MIRVAIKQHGAAVLVGSSHGWVRARRTEAADEPASWRRSPAEHHGSAAAAQNKVTQLTSFNIAELRSSGVQIPKMCGWHTSILLWAAARRCLPAAPAIDSAVGLFEHLT
jgi:hypothetical protein